MIEILTHTLKDTLITLPFLFLAYLVMEYIEHKAENLSDFIKKSRVATLVGSLFGIIPQCGFSASAAGLFSGGLITPGTLVAVFLATSDEMLPILIAKQAPVPMIIKVLIFKFAGAVITGYLIDLLYKRKKEKSIHDLCHESGCHCEEHEGVVIPALIHTAKVAVFIFAVTFILTAVIHHIGEDALAGFILNKPVIGNLLAALIGLIPNCAASVVITELYLSGAMSAGAMLSGLFVGAGVGLAVLFRTNKNIKENLMLTLTLFVSGVILGLIFGLIPIW
ncbi:MAG: arsenic efflux protein [Clostridia bacterium]|nr:arsenic efflux protein [Clostridia bacterium]